MSSLRVRVHARDTSTSGPILLSFSAGPPPPELLHASAPHGLTFDYMRSASSAQSSRRTLVAESDVVRLEARNYGAAAVSADAPFRCGAPPRAQLAFPRAFSARARGSSAYLPPPPHPSLPPLTAPPLPHPSGTRCASYPAGEHALTCTKQMGAARCFHSSREQ